MERQYNRLIKKHIQVRNYLLTIGLGFAALLLSAPGLHMQAPDLERPNILFCFADDQSWPHASAYGDKVVKTPNFDRIATAGVLFNNAYCSSPSCTPSRSAVLTGQDIWRLEEGAQLFGTLPAKFPIYTNMLSDEGYLVGFMEKGWAPGDIQAGGHKYNPAGRMSYENFKQFHDAVEPGQPWCFWFGSRDPHRGYKKGSGIASGMDPNKVEVPPVFPDAPEVRSDICDYYYEIERFDSEVGAMLKLIEDSGQMDNTIVVVTSDNGMPFPRAKANLYDLGVHMPLAISWKKQIPGGRNIDDFVNLSDLAPTFLEAAGIKTPPTMTGKSLMNILSSVKSGRIDPERDCVVTARERHAWCRIDGKGYGSRMIRTEDLLYIRNYNPERQPSGIYSMVTNEGHYGDVDASPTKDFMLKHKEKPEDKRLFNLSFGKRPAEELYDCRKDPFQMNNLAEKPAYKEKKEELATRLTTYLKETNDPRETSKDVNWDKYKYYGYNKWPIINNNK